MLSLLNYLSNFIIADKKIVLYALEVYQSHLKEKVMAVVKDTAYENEISHHSRFFVANLYDTYEYHLAPKELFEEVPTEKSIAIFKDITNTVSLDLEIEVDYYSTKIIQVQQDLTVDDLVTSLAPKRFPQVFREVSTLSDSFWLYIAVANTDQDIPLLYNSSMSTVRHLLNWFKSVYGNGNVSLMVRRRAFCGRSIFSIDKLGISEVNLNYNRESKNFLNKPYFTKFLKEDKLVECLAIMFYLKYRHSEQGGAQKLVDIKPLEMQTLLSPDHLKMYDVNTWSKKVTASMNKNLLIKKQTEVAVKRRFLHMLKECKFFSADVFDFEIHKERMPEFPKIGRIVANITGIHIFRRTNFKYPDITVLINDILEIDTKGSKIKIKFLFGKDIKTVFLKMSLPRQLAENISSSMLLGLRDNRFYFFSYMYIAKMLPSNISTRDKIMVDQIHGSKINKCYDYLNSLGDNLIPFSELPFTGAFFKKIPKNQTDTGVFYYPFKKSDMSKDAKNTQVKRPMPKQMVQKKKTPLENTTSVKKPMLSIGGGSDRKPRLSQVYASGFKPRASQTDLNLPSDRKTDSDFKTPDALPTTSNLPVNNKPQDGTPPS